MSRRTLIATLVFSLASPAAALAQEGLPVEVDEVALRLELAKPFFDDPGFGNGFGAMTSMLDATVLVPLESVTLFGRLGLTHATIEGLPSSQTLSNPRLGVLFGSDSGTKSEVHVDLPLAQEYGDDDYATGVAFLADFERLERFVPDAWSIGGSVTPQRALESGGVVGGRVGGTIWIPTEGGDTEVFALYGLFGRVPAGSVEVGGELSGIALLSEDELSFNERTHFYFTASARLPDVAAAPELYVRVPFDSDTQDFLNFVVGVRVLLGG